MTKVLPMSRFIQNYNQHLAEAERTDKVFELHLRAGRPTWVMETELRVYASKQASVYISAIVGPIVHDDVLLPRIVEQLPEALPWLQFLPEEDRLQFTVEATDCLRACASIGRFTAFSDLVDDWRNTAELWSDPQLAASLRDDVSEPLDVPVGENNLQ